MTPATALLASLKIDLGIKTNAYDTRLTAYLGYAQSAIAEEGITLSSSLQDDQLTIMYAAWMWRRRDTGEGMPRMVRYALNNRLFAQKMNPAT